MFTIAATGVQFLILKCWTPGLTEGTLHCANSRQLGIKSRWKVQSSPEEPVGAGMSGGLQSVSDWPQIRDFLRSV